MDLLSSRGCTVASLFRSVEYPPGILVCVSLHFRDCLMEKPHAITRFFGSGTMTKLGALAFPMFILHGPIGQIFYKKPLAWKEPSSRGPKEDRREALGWNHAKEVLSALPLAGDACWSLHQRVLRRRLRTAASSRLCIGVR